MLQQMMSNPDMLKQAQAMMSGGAGGMNAGNMQEMMKDPSLQGLMKNPEFLQNTIGMLKDPKNKAMLDMIQ